MKKIKKWRYYCEHCGKSGGSGGHMKKHEEHCTANPGRKCGMCELAGCSTQRTVSELVNFMYQFFDYEDNYLGELFPEFKGVDTMLFGSDEYIEKSEEVMENLREFVNGCPACMLTAMRFTNSCFLFQTFNWEKEKAQFYTENTPQYGDW